VVWLDGVRGAAAMFVVLHHMWLRVWPQFPDDAGPWWLGWLLYGHLAVAVFIVVSGFSLGLAPIRDGGRLRGGMRRFLRRRAWRILPPYWAALVLSMVVTAAFLHPYLGAGQLVKAFTVHTLLVQDMIGSQSPNGAFWSIAVEWQIYFVFPLILWVGRARGTESAVAVTLIAVLAANAASGLGAPLDKIAHLTPQFLALFAFGVLAVELALRPQAARLLRPLGLTATATLAALVAFALVHGSRWMVERYFYVDLLFGFAVACALCVLMGGGWRLVRAVLSTRTSLRLGAVSYSIYLVHEPIVGLLYQGIHPLHLPAVARFGLFAALGVPAVLVLSYGFHLVFEAPFLRHRSLRAFETLPLPWIRFRGTKPAPAPVELAAAPHDA
jgi:peptidoglycan/LPS O-acetylase OafA/YrhL